MNRQCERLIGILCQPIKNRHIDEIRLVTDWLRDTIPCLRTEESGIVHEVLRLGTYKRCLRDEVVACPAQKDDGIYIILSGSASVYVKQKHRDFASEVGAINEDLDDATTTTNTNTTNTTTNTTANITANTTHTNTTTNTTTTNTTTNTIADDGSTVSDGEPHGRRRHSTTIEKKPGVAVAAAVVERSTSVNNKPVAEKLNRDKMGKLVAKFSVGKCVGSAAVKTDESLRNATVVSDDIVHLLHLSQQVYDQTLKPSREQELTFRRKFIELHPVFASCSVKVKQLLEMLLTKQFYPSGQPIVRQGDQYNGLVFILSGQANIIIEPDKHRTQYNEHLQSTSTNQTEDIQNETTAAKKSRDSSTSPNQRQRPRPALHDDPIRVRKRHGYVAAEKRLRSRRLTVCCVERGEIIGDIELVAGLDTYCQTVTPTTTQPVDAYVLTVKSIERIGSKAFLQSMNVLKLEVETKLSNRIERLKDNGPPLFPSLLERLRVTDEERPVELPPLVSSKSLPTAEELFQHLLKSFVENRSALCQPYVPGSVFYRDMMRTKAVQRRSDPETAVKPAMRHGRPAARVKALLGPLKPLTTRAIKVALKRQEEELEKVEETARLHEMRSMEEERTRNECEKVRMEYRMDAGTPPLTEKAMMNLQQVLLNKLRHHHSTQNGGGLPSDMEMDTGRSRTKVTATDPDPYKILLQSPRSDKNAKLQAIKVRSSKDKVLQTSSSIENGISRSSMDSGRPPLPTINNETDTNEQQTDIKSLLLNNNDTERQNITTSGHFQTENDLKSTAIQADTNHEALKTDSKKLRSPLSIGDTAWTGKDTKPRNQTENWNEAENKLNEKNNRPISTSMVTTADVLLGSADKIGLQLERTRTLISEMDRHSEPADLQTEADDSPKERLVREVHSARADVNLPPQRRVPISREQIQVENRKMKEAVVLTLAKELCEERARNRLNKDLVSADDALYESPSYRDWETSDRSLKYLEERIARFYVETEKEKSSAGKTTMNIKPTLLPKLRRFEPTDDSPKHAVPGGRVYVKRRACDVQKANGTAVKNHDHVRYHLLPSIPNYDQLRTSKMVMFQMLDDARQQWIDEH